jgi:hypothetical protein
VAFSKGKKSVGIRIWVPMQSPVGHTSCFGKVVLFENLLVSYKYAA